MRRRSRLDPGLFLAESGIMALASRVFRVAAEAELPEPAPTLGDLCRKKYLRVDAVGVSPIVSINR